MLGAVGRELDPELNAQIGPIHVQSIKPHEHAAAAATPTRRNGVNLTIELWAPEVQLNLVGWKTPRPQRFFAGFDRTPRVRGSGATPPLKWLPSGGSRLRSGKTVHPFGEVRGSSNWPRISAPAFSREALEALISRVPADDKLGIHVRLAWPRKNALKLGASIVKDMADGVRSLAPLVDEINNS